MVHISLNGFNNNLYRQYNCQLGHILKLKLIAEIWKVLQDGATKWHYSGTYLAVRPADQPADRQSSAKLLTLGPSSFFKRTMMDIH